MIKSFCTDDHAGLIEAAGGKVFTFFERSDRMTKSASDVISRADLQGLMPPDTHFGVHLITMGAEETFGPNRNGDSASQHALDTYHHTFEKFGHVYREHKNRDPRTQGVGQVKLARVNPKMHRGELVAWVEKAKAPDMYKAAKEGKELSWSMSMRLPHDECSCCRKKSRNTGEYCEDLKHHMLQFRPGFQKYAYARNEEGVKFFDISEVKRRADRIATYLGYFGDDALLHKAAADGDQVVSGAQWGEYFHGAHQPVPFSPWEELTLEKLASAEEFVRHANPDLLSVMAQMAPMSLSRDHIETIAQPDFRSVSGELAKRAMIINFPTFASVITGKSISDLEKDAGFCDVMGIKLPSLMSDLFSNGGSSCGGDAAAAVSPDECGCAFSPSKDAIDTLMREVGDDLGMSQDRVNNRVVKVTVVKSASLRRPSVIQRPLDPFYSALAEAYGHYVVKAAHIAKDVPGVSANTLFRSIAAALLIQAS